MTGTWPPRPERMSPLSVAVVTPPAAEPVSMDVVRAHLRLDEDHPPPGDLELLRMMVTAAREDCEHEIGWLLVERELELTFAGALGVDLPLGYGAPDRMHPLVPITEVVSITYLDPGDGMTAPQWVEVDPQSYLLLSSGISSTLRSVLDSGWPIVGADPSAPVRVRVRAGRSKVINGVAVDVPAAAQSWMLLQIAALWRNREAFAAGVSTSSLPDRFFDRLLDRLRVYVLA